MNVYFLCNALPRNTTGGAERQLLLAARELARLGVQCQIRTLVSSPVAQTLEPQVGELQKVGVAFGKFAFGELVSMRESDQVFWTWGRRADTIIKVLKPLLPGRLFCSIRDSDEANMQRFRHIERLFNGRVDRYVTNSQLAAGQLARYVPNVPGRVFLLLNALVGIPEPAPRPRESSEFRVGMLGNIFIHKKGYDTALEAAARLKERGEKIVVRIAGHDHTQGAFPKEIAQRGLQDFVKFEGATGRPLEFLASNDAFLMLSRYEGCPNSLMEAMSLGLPAISTTVGDLPHLFESGVHLELLARSDAALVVQALLKLKNNRAEAARLGERGRARCIELFSRDRLKKDLARLLGVRMPAPIEESAAA